MRKFSLVLASLLCATLSLHPPKNEPCDCEQAEAACKNLAVVASWKRKALFGLMHPQFMADVVAEMEAAKNAHDDNSILAAMAFWEFEPYLAAIEGDFNEYGTIFTHQPLAVFADDKGDGIVLYKSGFGYRVGSQINRRLITEISSESMTVKNMRTGEVEIIHFNELYLAGRIVDEKGLGPARVPWIPKDVYLKAGSKD